MATVVLNAYSKAYPSITNNIRASVYLQSSPQALVASIVDSNPGHPARTWSFPGLQKNNYGFSLDVVDSLGNPIGNLALFDVVPGQSEGVLVRDDEQIKVNITPGFTAGLNTVTFDGTNGKPNYIGWEIVPSELTGRGILVKNQDYTWNSVSGVFQLLDDGDILSDGTVYNIHFNDKLDNSGGSVPTDAGNPYDFIVTYETEGRPLTPQDFGRKLVIEPASPYEEFILPDITTVTEGRKLMVEIEASADVCVRFLPTGSNGIKFARGNLYATQGESFSVYRFTRNSIPEWRVYEYNGNFKTVGQIVSYDSTDVSNCLKLNGAPIDKNQYARLYNEVVLNLPLQQLISFEAHENDDVSRAKYSTANDLGQFYLPYRSGLFNRNTFYELGYAGVLQQADIGPHSHPIEYILEGNDGNPTSSGEVLKKDVNDGTGSGQGGSGTNYFAVKNNTGIETRPINYSINQYILI